jgi:hypothetical protein
VAHKRRGAERHVHSSDDGARSEREKDAAVAAIALLLEFVRIYRDEITTLTAITHEFVLYRFPGSGNEVLVRRSDLADPHNSVAFCLRAPSGDERRYTAPASSSDWRFFASHTTGHDRETLHVRALLMAFSRNARAATAAGRSSRTGESSGHGWSKGQHVPTAVVELDDPTGRRKDRALVAIAQVLAFVRARKSRLEALATQGGELVLHRFPESKSSVAVRWRDLANREKPPLFHMRAASGEERAYTGPGLLEDWRFFAVHTTLDEIEAFCATNQDRVVFATELEACSAPGGTGSELEATSAPAGRGSELEAVRGRDESC